MQIFRFSTARIKINKLFMSFSSHKSVLLYILHHPSVTWHIILLKSSDWNVTGFGQKRAYQCTIFQTFECSNESSPSSSCHFSIHKVKVYSKFTSLFSVMKDNSSVFFSLNLIHFGQKDAIKNKCPHFWVVGWKFTKFFMSCLKPKVS